MQFLITLVQTRFEAAIKNETHLSGLSGGDAALLGSLIVYEGLKNLADAVLSQGAPQALEPPGQGAADEFRAPPAQVNVQVIPPGQPVPQQVAAQAPPGQ